MVFMILSISLYLSIYRRKKNKKKNYFYWRRQQEQMPICCIMQLFFSELVKKRYKRNIYNIKNTIFNKFVLFFILPNKTMAVVVVVCSPFFLTNFQLMFQIIIIIMMIMITTMIFQTRNRLFRSKIIIIDDQPWINL